MATAGWRKFAIKRKISANGLPFEEDSSPNKQSNLKEELPKKNKASKRTNYLPWDDYFMAVAFLSAQRSKDPSSQVGACIVNSENKIVGIGYNGMPNGCSDDELPWDREAEDELDTKYPYACENGKISSLSELVKKMCNKDASTLLEIFKKEIKVCHAEMNAVLNKNSADVKGCIMYVALFPCNECTKIVIQSGLKEIVYVSDKYHDKPAMVASRRMLDMAGIKYRQFTPTAQNIVVDFSSIDGTKSKTFSSVASP